MSNVILYAWRVYEKSLTCSSTIAYSAVGLFIITLMVRPVDLYDDEYFNLYDILMPENILHGTQISFADIVAYLR